MPKIPGLTGGTISNRVEKADLMASKNPVYQQLANIGGEVANIGLTLRKKEMEAESANYIQRGMRESLAIDADLAKIRSKYPTGEGYAEEAIELIQRRQQSFYDTAPSEYSKRRAQSSLSGSFFSQERSAGMDELRMKQQYRTTERKRDLLLDADRVREAGGELPKAIEMIRAWEDRGAREKKDADPNNWDNIGNDVIAAQNSISFAHVNSLIDAGKLNAAEDTLNHKVAGGDVITSKLRNSQFRNLKNRIRTERNRVKKEQTSNIGLDLSELYSATEKGTVPDQLTINQMKTNLDTYKALNGDKDPTYQKLAKKGVAVLEFSDLLEEARGEGAFPADNTIRDRSKVLFEGLEPGIKQFTATEDLTREISEKFEILNKKKNSKDPFERYEFIGAVSPDTIRRASNIHLDPLKAPSIEDITNMNNLQKELKDIQEKWGIEADKGVRLIPEHKEMLSRLKNIAEGPEPDLYTLKTGILNTARLYGQHTPTALKEAGLEKYTYLPSMSDGGLALIKAQNEDISTAADQIIKNEGLMPKTVKEDIRKLIMEKSDVVKSSIATYLGSEDPVTAMRSMNELTEQLTQLAYVQHTNNLRSGRGGYDSAVDYAVGMINLNKGKNTQDGVSGYTSIQAGKFPIAFDASIPTNREDLTKYLTHGMNTWDWKRNYVKEFDIATEEGFEDIVNDNIRQNAYWSLNPDKETVSLYGVQRDGKIGVYKTKEGKPVSVNIRNFSKDTPEYNKYKGLMKRSKPFDKRPHITVKGSK